MAKSLRQLIDEVRDRADQPGSATSGFITDKEMTIWINSSIAELHDLLITSYGADYYLNKGDIALSEGTESYTLPADFYKLKGVDLKNSSISSRPFNLRPYNFNERNNYSQYSNTVYENYRYRVGGNSLYLIPHESINSGDIVTLWYHPIATKLSLETDEFNGINGYEEYVILDCCIKAAIKEESDAASYYQQKSDMKMRIIESADNRSEGGLMMTDVYAENEFNADFY